MYFIFCSCRGKFKSERDYCDLEDGNNDVLVLGYEPALINYADAGLGRFRKQMTTGSSATSDAKSLASSMSPPTHPWTLFKKNPPSSSSVAPMTEAAEATVTQERTSSAVPTTENMNTVKIGTSQKTPGEKVVQLLEKGVWTTFSLVVLINHLTLYHAVDYPS